MANFASGQNAWGDCDRCGLRFKLLDLRKITIANTEVALKVCPSCWEPDHPQLQKIKIVPDAEALYEPRPDQNVVDSRNIAWGWKPVEGMQVAMAIGTMMVTT